MSGRCSGSFEWMKVLHCAALDGDAGTGVSPGFEGRHDFSLLGERAGARSHPALRAWSYPFKSPWFGCLVVQCRKTTPHSEVVTQYILRLLQPSTKFHNNN